MFRLHNRYTARVDHLDQLSDECSYDRCQDYPKLQGEEELPCRLSPGPRPARTTSERVDVPPVLRYAIAGFIVDQLYFANSPWDRFLAGNSGALTDSQLVGAKTFLSLKCVRCHNGPAFTDNQFHNVAIAQFGPGEGNGPAGNDDFGRFNVTGAAQDKYAFRTTPLRNVELTGPYGHDGAFIRLRDFIDHYSESALKLVNYDPSQLIPSLQGTVLANASDILATRDTIITTVVFPAAITDDLTVFMGALTDPAARNLRFLVPSRVPSGLPIDQ